MNATEGGQGAQIALGYNRVYRELTGIQIAAVNIGRDVSGAQVGLVNIARRVDGVQLGLVNVADRASAPIGAVSWMHSGERAIEVWGGEALSLAAGVRMGTGRVYSIAGIASGPLVERQAVGTGGRRRRQGRVRSRRRCSSTRWAMPCSSTASTIRRCWPRRAPGSPTT